MTSEDRTKLLFVVGFYRSGTSLLHALLNKHPAISLMYECDVLKLSPLLGRRSVRKDWPSRLEFWNQSISRHGLNARQVITASNRTEAALALYRAYGARKSARVLGEKSPNYHDCLPKLARDFPESSIVVLWRSPEEILKSIRQAAETDRYFEGASWRRRVAIGLNAMAAGCEQLRASGHRLLEINYSSLVQDERTTLKGICDFVNIDFDPQITSLAGADLAALPPGDHHRNVRGGKILAGNRANRQLSAADQNFLAAYFPADIPAPWNASPMPLSHGCRSLAYRFHQSRTATCDWLVRTLYAYGPAAVLLNWRARRDRRFNAIHSRSLLPTLQKTARSIMDGAPS